MKVEQGFVAINHLADGHPLVVGKDVWHLSGVEHVIDVLNERLIDDLGVRKEERHRDVSGPGSLQDGLQVFPPLRVAVVFADLDLRCSGRSAC